MHMHTISVLNTVLSQHGDSVSLTLRATNEPGRSADVNS